MDRGALAANYLRFAAAARCDRAPIRFFIAIFSVDIIDQHK